jgi:hypothetical protein
MMSRKRPVGATPTEGEAQHLQAAIRALGEYGHVSVRPVRGCLNIFAGDDQPVARLTPLGGGHFGLSFMRHTGRWEPMPFSGLLSDMPDTIVSTLAPYLARYDFSSRISGSDH